MYHILFSAAAIVQFILIIAIVSKNFTGSRVFKALIIFVLYLSGNTISGMIGYYAKNMTVDRYYLLGGQAVCIILEIFLLLRSQKAKKIRIGCENKTQEIIWLVFFGLLFFMLLCSTQFTFMPVWGNVDEAVHIEVSAQFRNILDGGANPFYRMLGGIDFSLSRYSYLWAYHYNCAAISKVFHLDVLYINHIMKCLSLSLFISAPILWIKTSKKGIAFVSIGYAGLMLLFAGNWYLFFQNGYTAQIFSLAIAHIFISIYVSAAAEENKMIRRIVLPVMMLFCLISYMLTGAVLLVFTLIVSLYKKDIKGFLFSFLYCAFIIPLPPIWNQILFFLFRQGSADEALTAGSALTESPSFLWIVIGILMVIALICRRKSQNAKWMFYFACWYLLFFAVYFLGDSIGYVMYKIMITMFPMLILWLCYECFEAASFVKSNALVKNAGFILLLAGSMFFLVKTGIASVSGEMIKKTVYGKPQITKDEYACMKTISQYEAYDGVEYIGMNGPSARVGFVYLRKIPFSWTGNGTGWSFKANFYLADILDGVRERILSGEPASCIYVLINEDRTEDMNGLDSFSSLVSENTEVYRSGNCAVRKLSFKDSITVESLSYEDILVNKDFTAGKIPFYDECALVGELDQKETLRVPFEKERTVNILEVKGRSIHDSEFILRLLDGNDVVWEGDVSGFEKQKIIQFDEGIACDSYEISVTGKNFSDSIIIKEVNFYEISE